MQAGKMVPDSKFREIEEEGRRALSAKICKCGMAVTGISAQTGIGRAAIRRALDGRGIRYDTALRLHYFLDYLMNQQNNTKSK